MRSGWLPSSLIEGVFQVDPTSHCDGGEDPDGDGWCAPEDCAPDDATRSPDAVETCDDVDNDCDGTADGGGVCVPPFELSLSEMVLGQPMAVSLSGAPPGARLYVLATTAGTGEGPCEPTTGLCTDLLVPRVLRILTANGAGEASFTVPVQTKLGAGRTFHFQGVWADFVAAEGGLSDVQERVTSVP